MRINSRNIKIPAQEVYSFNFGEMQSDPAALSNYLAGVSKRDYPTKPNPFMRSYEKAKRVQRMAERANKETRRRGYD